MTKTFKEEAERIVINLYLGKTFTEIVPNWRAELKNPKIDAAIEALQHLHDAEVAKAYRNWAALELEYLEVAHALHNLPQEYVRPLKYRLEVLAGLQMDKETL